MTHILVTNDDGVDSPGLFALKQALDRVGRVSVIAPDRNRSAIGRSITIHSPLHIDEVTLPDGSRAYATDGTPVDCVRFAMLGFLEDGVPDIVVSGINLGHNLGDDVTYSGTVAAAFEGVLLGWPAIAVSQEYAGEWSKRGDAAGRTPSVPPRPPPDRSRPAARQSVRSSAACRRAASAPNRRACR